jgi:hypothetical protein
MDSGMNINIKSTIFRKKGDSKAIDLDEEGVIYQINRIEEKFIANTTAMAIWDLLDGRRTSQEIAQAIALTCGAKLEEVEFDVYNHLEKLRDLGFIRER